jgi:hypothetical protein
MADTNSPEPSTGPHDPRVGGPVRASSEEFISETALAHAYGSPVYVPSRWPAGLSPLVYVLERFTNGHSTHYRIEVIRDDGLPINIVGFSGRPSQKAGRGGWEPVSGMERDHALARQRENAADVVVWKQMQYVVLLIGYGSLSEAIEAAQSLRQV